MQKLTKEKIKNLLFLGRYNYPTGAFLLMWPCFWGVLYEPNFELNLFKILGLFFIGSFVMRGVGCCINDYFDKDLDKKVYRTKNRPLAKGLLNDRDLSIFIILQLFIGLVVVLNFNLKVIFFSFLIIPLVVIYPLFKRVTYLPQVFLGLVFNWGILIGFLTQNSELNLGIIFLYCSGIFLTIAYDTIYAFQDIKDDKNSGIKSLAILIEKKPTLSLALFFFLNYLFLNLSILQSTKINITNLFIITSLILICHIRQLFIFKKRREFKSIFDFNIYVGGLITLIIFVKNYL